MEWPDLGTTLFGAGDVVQVECILGADFAADVAVTKMDARPLLLTLCVDERLAVRLAERVGQVVVPLGIEREWNFLALTKVRTAAIVSDVLTGPFQLM